MIFAVGIILGVIAVFVLGYPFLNKGAGGPSVDAGLEDEIESRIRELRQAREGKSQAESKTLCPECGMECDPRDKFCRNCGARLT